jgi:purine nucleoside permease
MKLRGVVLLLMTTMLLAAACTPVAPRPSPASDAGSRRSIILTAFGDSAGTFGETQPFLQALQNKVDRTAEAAFCEGVYEGELSGQPVVVVTTGTGADNAGPCMQELLYWYGPQVKEVIWSGIGGVTPAVGGIVDDAGRRRAGAAPVMIGDVCISALAWNYDLHFSSVGDWRVARTDGAPYDPAGGWWPMKNSDGSSDVLGFDNVQQFVIADTALADELLVAAQQVAWPAMDEGVRAKVEHFFTADQVRAVRVFDYTQCGEVAGNNFWHGAVESKLARQYLAGLITAAGFVPAREDAVVSFSAMEAAAWMSVLARWNAHHGTQIPMAVIRGASNYDQVALDATGNPVKGEDSGPLTAIGDIQEDFQEAGASFAWGNAAQPVLKLFELRGAQ